MGPNRYRPWWPVVVALLAIAIAAYAWFGHFSFLARMQAVALDEVTRLTVTPKSVWVVRACNYNGESWRVTLQSWQGGGTVMVTLSPQGELLAFETLNSRLTVTD